MITRTRIQKISLDLGHTIITYVPVDWEVEIEGEIKKNKSVEIHILSASHGRFCAGVRSGLEGRVIAFNIGGLTLYSVLPVPEGFHGNAS